MIKLAVLVLLSNFFCFNALEKTGHFIIEDDVNEAVLDSGTETKWIDLPVDHFNNQDKRTWKLRYFENLQFFKPKGPIYLFLVGSIPASPAYITGSYVWNLANETNGAIFAVEHRFYGKSIPVDINKANFEYLNSEQALADFANLTLTLKSISRFKDSKVAVFGGYYAGSLAAWMRLKYPHVVDAAWASSAPVLAKKNNYEYLLTYCENLKQYNPYIYNKILKTMSDFDAQLQTDEGRKQLKKDNQICDWCDLSQPLNKASFMTANIYLYYFRDRCYQYDFWIYSYMFHIMGRLWFYQQCTQFGFFHPSVHGEKFCFTKDITLDYELETCKFLFGSEFNESRVDRGIANTNKQYGGLTPNVTKVVFLNGDRDPLAIGIGIFNNISEYAPAIIMHTDAHCRELHPEKPQDPNYVKEARKIGKSYIKKWLGLIK